MARQSGSEPRKPKAERVVYEASLLKAPQLTVVFPQQALLELSQGSLLKVLLCEGVQTATRCTDIYQT